MESMVKFMLRRAILKIATAHNNFVDRYAFSEF